MRPADTRLEARPLPGLPEVRSGMELAPLVAGAALAASIELSGSDVLVVAQKIVSKAEGRLRALSAVDPTPRAAELGRQLGKDPRQVQVILDESAEVLRAERGVIITRTHHGLVCANAGVDASNVPGADVVCLLPTDPDASARALRAALGAGLARPPAIVVSDSFGRAWRLGQAEVAIGCAGLAPLDDLRGSPDSEGRPLSATVVAVGDEAAAAAGLVRRKSGREAIVLVRGLERYVTDEDGPGASAIIRPGAEDLFR